jgi:hypothetical protein
LAYQPPANSTFLSEQTSHPQPASSTFLSEKISTLLGFISNSGQPQPAGRKPRTEAVLASFHQQFRSAAGRPACFFGGEHTVREQRGALWLRRALAGRGRPGPNS